MMQVHFKNAFRWRLSHPLVRDSALCHPGLCLRRLRTGRSRVSFDGQQDGLGFDLPGKCTAGPVPFYLFWGKSHPPVPYSA